MRLSGRIAWLAWLVVHITFMTGFKNRFTAFIGWLFCFIGTGRLERAIVGGSHELFAPGEVPDDRRDARGGAQRPPRSAEMNHEGASHLDRGTQ